MQLGNKLVLEQKPISISRGSDVSFDLFLYDEDFRPFDLTLFDKFSVCIKSKNATNDILTITETVNAAGSIAVKQAPNELGHIIVTIKAADVNLLETKAKQDIDIKVDNAGTPAPRTFRFNNILEVLDNACQ